MDLLYKATTVHRQYHDPNSVQVSILVSIKTGGSSLEDCGYRPQGAVITPELVKMQFEGIKNIKIDKVNVWENGSNSDGKSSTANFLSGMYKSVSTLQEMFNLAGMELPEYLKGKDKEGKIGVSDNNENPSDIKDVGISEEKIRIKKNPLILVGFFLFIENSILIE